MPPPNPSRSFQAPRGTRDFYPIEMARRLWLEDKWRRVATRHGFDEISGPTFEHLDLYTVKSGEGIVSELFSFTREGGETAYALRPEFTPTLARMVASKANALSKPIKWHSIGPYFRAERPQRGRLREFIQWNVDVVGDPSPEADAEVIACCVDSLREMGLGSGDVQLRVSNRNSMAIMLRNFADVPETRMEQAFTALDRRAKQSAMEFVESARAAGLNAEKLNQVVEGNEDALAMVEGGLWGSGLPQHIDAAGIADWCQPDASIVRGLAYYTGTVFEVHETGGKERALAGGGRYDNLVELFGGPPTPAVGFAMGDVVIALVLQDKGLMPSDDAIARDLGLAPDVFVICADEEADKHMRPLLAALRQRGLHARRSYRSTKNVGKLLGEASKANARYALILKPDLSAELKDMGAEGPGAPGQTSIAAAKSIIDLADFVQSRIPKTP